jgi:hypothetical protein
MGVRFDAHGLIVGSHGGECGKVVGVQHESAKWPIPMFAHIGIPSLYRNLLPRLRAMGDGHSSVLSGTLCNLANILRLAAISASP